MLTSLIMMAQISLLVLAIVATPCKRVRPALGVVLIVVGSLGVFTIVGTIGSLAVIFIGVMLMDSPIKGKNNG